MRLVNCTTRLKRRTPEGSVYIGRAMPSQPRSPLANPFMPRSKAPKGCRSAVVVPDESVLERYRRHLTSHVLEGFPELAALRDLAEDSVLACWCVERGATLVGAGQPEPDHMCHGDVIFTVWLALERLTWAVPLVDFQRDHDGANAAWRDLYAETFGEPLTWGGKRDEKQ